MAIDNNDKKWSMIRLGMGGPSLGGSLSSTGPHISLADQWIFVGRYWNSHNLGGENTEPHLFLGVRQRYRLVRRIP